MDGIELVEVSCKELISCSLELKNIMKSIIIHKIS